MTMQLGNGTLYEGSSGEEVKEIQKILAGQGYNPGPADGIFGTTTKHAVMAFQRAKGLLADGIVGPQTWAMLRGVPAAPPPPAPKPAPVYVTTPWSTYLPWIIGGIVFVSVLSTLGSKR